MSGSVETIKSFLVGLGFGVDDTSLAKFQRSITSATLRVSALYASTKLAAAGIVAGISEVSKGFEQMGYEYHIIAPAINKALLLRRELLKSYQLAGINIRKVVKDSINLNLSLTKTKFAFEAIYKSVASRFFQALTKQSDQFRKTLYANMPRIQAALEKFVKFVFKAVEVTTILGRRLWSILSRVWDFLVQLDKATGGWSTRILALVAAWELLNLSFLATPLGMVIAGLVALLALFDDFETWKEGGESLFNWGPFVPVINAVKGALGGLLGYLNAIGEAISTVIVAAIQAFSGDFSGALRSLKSLGGEVLDIFQKAWEAIKSIVGLAGSLGGWLSSVFGGAGPAAGAVGKQLNNTFGSPNAQANVAAANGGVASPVAPLGASQTSNQTNQHVSQQTTVHVQGVPDAQGVGNAVSGVMQKNNFDLVRNLQGSVRAGGVVP